MNNYLRELGDLDHRSRLGPAVDRAAVWAPGQTVEVVSALDT